MAKGSRGGKRGSSSGVNVENKLDDMSNDWAKRKEKMSKLGEEFGWYSDEFYEKLFDIDAKLYSKYQDGVANKENFFYNTMGNWESRKKRPNGEADYTSYAYDRRTGKSKVSSQYWYTKEGVYRKSDHWGSNVASCDWILDGVGKSKLKKFSKPVVGFIKWENLINKTKRVTINNDTFLTTFKNTVGKSTYKRKGKTYQEIGINQWIEF